MVTRTDIANKKEYSLVHYKGTSSFRGCQCYKDCTCREDYKPEEVNHYRLTIHNLTSKRPKSKSFYFDTLEEVNNKILSIKTLA